jgi:heme/copper-type cytochrome/quinol oxidase subunit 4
MTSPATAGPGIRLYVGIWIGLILIVAVEVTLTYQHLPMATLLMALLALASVEAALGLLYFMHLRYERRVLFWSTVPPLVFVLLMLNHLWRDAHRLITMPFPGP